MKKYLMYLFLCLIMVTFSSSISTFAEKPSEDSSIDFDSEVESDSEPSVSVLTENGEISEIAAEKIFNLLFEYDNEIRIDYYKSMIDDEGFDFFRLWSGTEYYDVYVIGNNIVKCLNSSSECLYSDSEKEADLIRVAELKRTIALENITYTVEGGDSASISLKGLTPGIICDIEVTYASGNKSSAKGLVEKEVAEDGRVSWEWNVGSRTTTGIATVRVFGESFSYSYEINIT